VLIVGSNLDPAASVSYGGVPSPSVSVDAASGGLVTVTPPHEEGFVDVVVTNPDGQTATSPGFHYGPAPVITSVAPASNVRPGTLVTVTGANFADVLGVQASIGPAIAFVVSKSPTQRGGL
jgi:hypothetical protein